jgi:hypothetical protein
MGNLVILLDTNPLSVTAVHREAAETKVIEGVISTWQMLIALFRTVKFDLRPTDIRIGDGVSIVYHLAKRITDQRDMAYVRRMDRLIQAGLLQDNFTLPSEPTRNALVQLVDSKSWFVKCNTAATDDEADVLLTAIGLLAGTEASGPQACLDRALELSITKLGCSAVQKLLERRGAKYYTIARLTKDAHEIFTQRNYAALTMRRTYNTPIGKSNEPLVGLPPPRCFSTSSQAVANILHASQGRQRTAIKEYLQHADAVAQRAAAAAAAAAGSSKGARRTGSASDSATGGSSSSHSMGSGRVSSGGTSRSSLPEKFRQIQISELDALDPASLREILLAFQKAAEVSSRKAALRDLRDIAASKLCLTAAAAASSSRANLDDSDSESDQSVAAGRKNKAKAQWVISKPPKPTRSGRKGAVGLGLGPSGDDEPTAFFLQALLNDPIVAEVILIGDNASTSNVGDLKMCHDPAAGEDKDYPLWDNFTWAIGPLARKAPYVLQAALRHALLVTGDLDHVAQSIFAGCQSLRPIMSSVDYLRYVRAAAAGCSCCSGQQGTAGSAWRMPTRSSFSQSLLLLSCSSLASFLRVVAWSPMTSLPCLPRRTRSRWSPLGRIACRTFC